MPLAALPGTAALSAYFTRLYDSLDRSRTFQDIGREVYGDGLEGQLGLVTRSELARVLEVLAPRPGARVLEVCAGSGRLTRFLRSQTGAEVVAADCARPASAAWRPYVMCDAEALPFATGAFDALVCVDGFSPRPECLLAECARSLRAGGTFAFALTVAVSGGGLDEAIALAGLSRTGSEDHTEKALDTLGRLRAQYLKHRRALVKEIGLRVYEGLTSEVQFLQGELSCGRRQRRLIYGVR